MAQSPGHRKHPEHKVREQHIAERVVVEAAGEMLGDSSDVIKVEEDGNPTRYYFPRADLKMDKLSRSETKSQCPFKGTAHYYSVKVGDQGLDDAAWTYEDPYEEHAGLKDRIAFYGDEVPAIEIRSPV